MSLNTKSHQKIQLNRKNIRFTQHGSVLTSVGGADKDIVARFGKGSFLKIKNLWKIKQSRTKIKCTICPNVWCRMLPEDDRKGHKQSSFHNGCLKKILRKFWPSKINNKNLHETTDMRTLLRKYNWRGIGQQTCLQKINKRHHKSGTRTDPRKGGKADQKQRGGELVVRFLSSLALS